MKISKEEIALYLSAYVNVLALATINPDKKIKEIFAELYIKGLLSIEPTTKNYEKMLYVHCIFCNIKLLGFLKDFFYTGLDENKLTDLCINDIDKINKECVENYTKKDIILYVRNALSHNDKEKSLYWIESDEENNLKVHIRLENTIASLGENRGKNIPFDLVITPQTLSEITQSVGFASKSSCMFGLNVKNKVARLMQKSNEDADTILKKAIDEIYYYRNFYKTLSDNEKERFNNISDENYIEEYRNNLDFKLNKMERKNLTPTQKITFYNNIKNWQNKFIDADIKELFDYESGKIIPTGLAKVDALFLSNLRSLSFLFDLSYNESNKILREGLCENKENVFSQCKYLFKSDVYEFKERLKFAILDEDNELDLTSSLFVGYLFDSLIKDEQININNKLYLRERIRNSFIHGRWYKSDKKWELFDGSKNEFNFDWHKSIDMINLRIYLERFLNSKLNESKTK